MGEYPRACQKCGGKGCHEATLRDLAGRRHGGYGIKSIVPCDFPSCRRGMITEESMEEYYESIGLHREGP